jgi:DNA-binding beta-propeller fold protein YncE
VAEGFSVGKRFQGRLKGFESGLACKDKQKHLDKGDSTMIGQMLGTVRLWRVICVCTVAALLIPGVSASEEIYKFERMWPTLQQPWYFYAPMAVAVDRSGYIYVFDQYTCRIIKLTSGGQFVTKWGTKGTGDGQFSAVYGMAVDNNGYIYVAETPSGQVYNNRIQKFTTDGQFVTKWGSTGSGDGQFMYPNGIAVDSSGYVYVADSNNYRIQKFTSDGAFVAKWGTQGSGDGQFGYPYGIAVDGSGYVQVTDYYNHRVQKFTSNGQFVAKWGTQGSGDGQFSYPQCIVVDSSGYVYLPDVNTNRIQKFTSDGQFVTKWGSQGSGDGQFDFASASFAGIAVDSSGYVYVTEYGNQRVQKFTSNGIFVAKWGCGGTGDGQFYKPYDIAFDSSGNAYVTDLQNNRVQKFTSDGQFVTKWGSYGTGDGQFRSPRSIAVDGSGNVYVLEDYFGGGYVEMVQFRVQKFTSSNGISYEFMTKWGSWGTGDGQFVYPSGIAVDGSNYVYVADYGNNRIQKFTSAGQFVTKWGSSGNADGAFNGPYAIAVDSSGYVYVADGNNNRVQKFTSSGQFVTKWGSYGTGDGQFNFPDGIAVDGDGRVYVSDQGNHRIQKFTPDGVFVAKWGESGMGPGQLYTPQGLEISPTGRVYVIDFGYNRIQAFKKVVVDERSKAIVVAGGGPFPGNTFWDATQMSANFAYRTLTYQGFTKGSIYYLSSNTALDLDNNGVADDVDGDATKTNLQNAITTWAADAGNVLIYLVDHGGSGTFRMNANETVTVDELNSWISSLQSSMPGRVTIVYDACEAGSFLSSLSGVSRTVITSTSPGESAYFVTQGAVSFSNYFWTHVFNGLPVKDAFMLASTSIACTTDFQHPLLDANGNGTGNEAGDFTLAQGQWIGNGTVIQGQAPVIESVSDGQTINGVSSAVLTASGVTDSDGIERVWAVIRPPDYNQGSSSNPVQGLPSVDLMPKGNDQYEGSYSGFNLEGMYHVVIYARDRIGNSSIPKLTTVTVGNPLRRRAVIVCGGSQGDALWPAVEKSGILTYEALKFQGYKDEDIYFLSPVSFSLGVDGTATLSNLQYALTAWGSQSTEDLVVYLVGKGAYGSFQINPTEILTATQLDTWLDSLQASLSRKVTLVYDADYAGSMVPNLTPPGGKQRIVIASTTASQGAQFLSDGDISFSKYFWTKVLNGANVRDAFVQARGAMEYCAGQSGELDDTGNGIANEKADGNIARYYTLGVGIMLAGDDPVIGSVVPGQTLYGTASATIWAENITTTGTIQKVWAVVSAPGYLKDLGGGIVSTVELTDMGGGHYERSVSGLTIYGRYVVGVYAMDTEGNVSVPKVTYVYQEVGPDLYEEDDTAGKARVIVVDFKEVQRHNFHDQGDEDWVKFYGVAGESYEIKTENLSSNCDTMISVYGSSGQTLVAGPRDDFPNGEGELLSWICPMDGVYYVKVRQYDPSVYGGNTGYDLKVYRPVVGGAGWIRGRVVNSVGSGVGGAVVTTSPGHASTISFQEGYYLLVVPAGTYSVTTSLGGYLQQTKPGIWVGEEGSVTLDFSMSLSGDITGDGVTDLADAILALKNLSGAGTGGVNVNPAADVNGDGKIGIAEAIYILQKAAGLR